MAIFGLVLTLASDRELERGVRERLAGDSRIRLGPACGARLPLVFDVDGPGDEVTTSGALPDPVRALRDWPGVLHVDLAFAHLGEERP